MDVFAEDINPGDANEPEKCVSGKPWVILLVDDDPEVHQITKLVLAGFQFKGCGLELISAYSADKARQIVESRNDIALALVDVVMESEHAGLELVKYIRSDLRNTMTRIVLRTGQAGQAPEDSVIQEYEIDGYKEKTELTKQKLLTLLYSVLRAYSDLCMIKAQKLGLSKVIEASAQVQYTRNLTDYATAVLQQLTSQLDIHSPAFYCVVPQDTDGSGSRLLTLAARDEHVDVYPHFSLSLLPEKVADRCREVIEQKQSKRYPDAYIYYSSNEKKFSSVLYFELTCDLSDLDRQLLEVYVQNISLTFENLNLAIDLQESSKEIVFNLANAVEARSKETGAHVQRVALVSEKLASYYGLSKQEVSMIKTASPLHDIGKVAIPDRILHKPGKLDAQEWCEMQRHVEYGVQMFNKSKRAIIVKAKEIVATHHEKWDGSGYPDGLSGEDIPVSGRITAIADVFDALGAKRCYKEAWTDDDIMAEILAQKGKHFDPELVDIMVNCWDELISIRDMHPD